MQIVDVVLDETQPEQVGGPPGIPVDNGALLDQTVHLGLVRSHEVDLLFDNGDVQVAIPLLKTGLLGHAQHVFAYDGVVDVLAELLQAALVGVGGAVGLAGIVDLFQEYPFAVRKLSLMEKCEYSEII